MSQVKIRPAVLEDALGIAQVHIQSWKETYAGIVAQSYLDELSIEKRLPKWIENLQKLKKLNAEYVCFVATDINNTIIGFVDGGAAREKQLRELGFSGELYAIYLLKKFHKQGIGKQLFFEFTKSLRQLEHKGVYLYVLQANPAVKFYETMGARFIKNIEATIGNEKFLESCYAIKWN